MATIIGMCGVYSRIPSIPSSNNSSQFLYWVLFFLYSPRTSAHVYQGCTSVITQRRNMRLRPKPVIASQPLIHSDWKPTCSCFLVLKLKGWKDENTTVGNLTPKPPRKQSSRMESNQALVDYLAWIQLGLKPGTYTWAFQLHETTHFLLRQFGSGFLPLVTKRTPIIPYSLSLCQRWAISTHQWRKCASFYPIVCNFIACQNLQDS